MDRFIIHIQDIGGDVYYMDHKRNEDGKLGVFVNKVSKANFNKIIKDYSPASDSDRDKLYKLINRHRKKYTIDLRALAA